MVSSPYLARRFVADLLLGAGLVCSLAGSAAAQTTSRSDAEARLGEVRERIETLARELNETRATRDRLSSSLRASEMKAAELGEELATLKSRQRRQEQHIAELTEQRGALDLDMARHRAALERYVRAAYATGRQDRLKLLLNQENPATLSRALAYYAYFNRARSLRIAALATDLERLADIERRISREVRELARLASDHTTALAALEAERERRQAVLATLAGELDTKGARLARLEADERELAELVENLSRALADIPLGGDAQASFPSLRGKLPWPAAGTLRYRFGTPRGSGDLTWKGVLVDAHPGAPVHAVSHGRVAFADWLRGFGLLMIIEHGDGYMSLYGHNQSLFKDVGDWVVQDEVVAKVGDTGGRSQSGLYFEIRHEGTPVDPLAWFRKEPRTESTAAAARPR